MDINYAIKDDGVAISFDYDRNLISEIKKITGHHFKPETKEWLIPFYSINELQNKVMVPQGIIDDSESILINRRKALNNDYFKYDLRDFQEDGVLFLLEKQKSFLCADMGLGKTFMSIAFVTTLLKMGNIDRAIVICPSSLKRHWNAEVKKFNKDNYKTTIISGTKKARMRQWEDARDSQYIIVNYDLARSLQDYPLLMKYSGDRTAIILDEATRIKNFKTKVAQKIKRLDASYKVALSGRPLENRLEDLYSINEFLDNNVLGSWNYFDQRYIVRNSWGQPSYYVNVKELHHKIKTVMFRCKREDVLTELPDKIVHDYYIQLSLSEHKDYLNILNPIMGLIERGTLGSLGTENNLRWVLSTIQLTKMFCDHPDLVKKSNAPMAKKLKIKTNKSSKFTEFTKIIQDIGDHKIVIFTQYAKMAVILRNELKKSYDCIMVTGNDKENTREEKLQHFKDDGQILVCTDVLGYGINLQHASCIINYDLPWNPAVLEQRVARLYRMGQKNAVNVINIVVEDEDKIEQKIKEILHKKDRLFEMIIEGH